MDMTDGDTADRVALRTLVDSYAAGVDRRDVAAVTKLFTEDGRFVVHFYRRADGSPTVRSGHAEIEVALEAGLGQYAGTTHVVGGQVLDIEGDTAHGQTTCLAHHVYERAGETRLLVMAVRYGDTFVRDDGVWRFAQRELRLDWRDDHPLGTP